MEKANKEIAEAMKSIDGDKIRMEINKALKEVDMAKIQKEVAESLAKVDWENMKLEMDKVKDIDMKKLTEEMKKVQEEMKELGPKMQKEMEKAKVEMEKAKAEMKEYKGFVDGLNDDGLISKKEAYKLKHKDGELFINGKKATDQTYNKYRTFLEKHKKFNIEKSSDDFDIDVDAAYRKTGLDGSFGQVCVIGFAIDDDKPITYEHPINESNLLEWFACHLVDVIQPHHELAVRVIGHNVSAFDLRLKLRVPGDVVHVYCHAQRAVA